jgi:hypothetical protein
LATVGGALALAASGLVGAVGLVAMATPAGAGSDLGQTTCNLSVLGVTTPTVLDPTVNAAITPSPVSAGSPFSLSTLNITSVLDPNSNPKLLQVAGTTLHVQFSGTLTATGASPSSQAVTFSGQVTLPGGANKPAWTQPVPITLVGSAGAFTAASGVTSAAVSLSDSGSLVAGVLNADGSADPALTFTGPCTGGASSVIASVPVVQPAAQVSNVIPNAGLSTGGTTIKIVGQHLSDPLSVTIDGVAAASFSSVSPTVITAVTAPGPNAPPNNDGVPVSTGDIAVTTPAGPPTLTGTDQFNYVDQTLGAIVTSVSPQAGPLTGGTPVTINGFGFDDVADFSNPVTDVYFGSVDQTNFTVVSNTEITTVAPPGTGIVDVRVLGNDGITQSPTSPQDLFNYSPGYFLGAADGGVFSYGQVPGQSNFFGSAGNLKLNKPVVGMAVTPEGGGYWLVAADGGVFAYGDAFFYGSAGGLTLNKPIVAIVATNDGAGYWLVAADGGIFAYGDAVFQGSAGNLKLNQPVVGAAATTDDGGYWLVAADGGIFAYGDAVFAGSTGGMTLNKPIVGMAASPTGGYWMVAGDGGVFAYGGAGFHGSLAGLALASPVTGIAATGDGGGYWTFTKGGAVFNLGNAGFYGDVAGIKLNAPVVGFSAVQSAVPPVVPATT